MSLLFLHRQEPGNVIVAAPAITTSARRDVAPLVSALVAVEEVESAPEMNRIYVNAEIPGDVEVRRALGVSEPSDEVLSRSAMDEP